MRVKSSSRPPSSSPRSLVREEMIKNGEWKWHKVARCAVRKRVRSFALPVQQLPVHQVQLSLITTNKIDHDFIKGVNNTPFSFSNLNGSPGYILNRLWVQGSQETLCRHFGLVQLVSIDENPLFSAGDLPPLFSCSTHQAAVYPPYPPYPLYPLYPPYPVYPRHTHTFVPAPYYYPPLPPPPSTP